MKFRKGLMTALFVTLYTVLWIQGATAVMGTPAVTSSSDINIMAQQQQSNHHGRHLCFEYFSRFITSVLFLPVLPVFANLQFKAVEPR